MIHIMQFTFSFTFNVHVHGQSMVVRMQVHMLITYTNLALFPDEPGNEANTNLVSSYVHNYHKTKFQSKVKFPEE